MKDAPEVSWHVKFDSQNLKHSGDLARWSTIIAPHESSIIDKRVNGIGNAPSNNSFGSKLGVLFFIAFQLRCNRFSMSALLFF